MAEWQLIETAPRDGKMVDLWVVPGGLSTGPGRITDCWYSIDKWWRYDENGDDQCRSEVWNATHWMPPPKPPRS